MTNIRTVLAENMKSRRKNLGISQSELAEKINTAPNYISKIEAERQFPSVSMLEKIALALNCDTIDLFSTQILNKRKIDTIEIKLKNNINNIISKYFEEIKIETE